jgi:hypothetical protein
VVIPKLGDSKNPFFFPSPITPKYRGCGGIREFTERKLHYPKER